MPAEAPSVPEICGAARRASRLMGQLSSSAKDAMLLRLTAALVERTPEVLEANARDLQAGEAAGLSSALMDRLRLDEERVAAMARGVREIAALPDPVGEVLEGRRLANGLDVRKVRVPLGVIAVVYEARPNVTIDAAALCVKSGNAIVLRGSGTAGHSNAALARIVVDLTPPGAVQLLSGHRSEIEEIARQDGLVDLVIPRGGEGLKETLQRAATVPVMYAASGNCHVYVDDTADLDAAEEIVVNAKAQRPGVCNAAETLLVHAGVAATFLPRIVAALRAEGVELRGDARVREHVDVGEARESDWGTEFLALELAIAVVDSYADAIDWIDAHGSGHSEAIVTQSTAAARDFQRGVDAACVYVNASTRFTDGGEFGMGAEIGNSTQKLHARGPIGLRELCTVKYLVEGDRHVRS